MKFRQAEIEIEQHVTAQVEVADSKGKISRCPFPVVIQIVSTSQMDHSACQVQADIRRHVHDIPADRWNQVQLAVS